MAYRNALVTGASSGIGRALSKRLARDGTHVVACARRTAALSDLVDEITREGGSVQFLTLDVADAERTVAAIREVDAAVGGLDLVVANAGLGATHRLEKITWESVAPLLHTNFTGAIATLTAVLPAMVARRRGHLVAVSSLAAVTPLPSGASYCATKSGLATFLDSLRFDLEGTGVHVTTVLPGVVKTPLAAKAKNLPPMAMECDAAVDLIVDRLRGAPARIEFPWAMAAMLHLVASFPRPLREAALRRFPVPEEAVDMGAPPPNPRAEALEMGAPPPSPRAEAP